MKLHIVRSRYSIFSERKLPLIYKILRTPMAIQKTLHIETFFSKEDRQFYFHIKARNGKLVVQSEGYKTKQAAQKTAKLIAGAKFVVVEKNK